MMLPPRGTTHSNEQGENDDAVYEISQLYDDMKQLNPSLDVVNMTNVPLSSISGTGLDSNDIINDTGVENGNFEFQNQQMMNIAESGDKSNKQF